MNFIDRILSKTPKSDDSWHCPWFKVIEGLSFNGMFWGLWSLIFEGVWLGGLAFVVGLAPAMFTFGTRSRGSASC